MGSVLRAEVQNTIENNDPEQVKHPDFPSGNHVLRTGWRNEA